MSLRELSIKKEYRSLNDEVVADFYIPVLNEALKYDRAVGYFSSSVLIQISKGLCGLIKNGGKVRLIASPYLSEEDMESINKGYLDRDTVIKETLLKELKEHEEYYDKERLNLLSNLIASGVLDIKIALTTNKKSQGLYHEKMGIVTDTEGNRMAFSGSMNETEAALTLNYEAIDVFCEWNSEDEKSRVNSKASAFDRIWENSENSILVMDFPEIKEAIIRKYRKNDNVMLTIDEEQLAKLKGVKKQSVTLPEIPASVTLHRYQEDAIDEWAKRNYRGIFDMATGTGKTYTGLGAIVNLSYHLSGKLAV